MTIFLTKGRHNIRTGFGFERINTTSIPPTKAAEDGPSPPFRISCRG
jgi:hypothetical protein